MDDIEHEEVEDARLAAEWKSCTEAIRKALKVKEFSMRAVPDIDEKAVHDLIGTVNAARFLDKPPGTVLFSGADIYCEVNKPELTCHFRYRPTPWNRILDTEGEFIEARDDKGNPPYRPADFSPLHAERIG